MTASLTVQRNITDINVKDYGAQGDGSTDDTTAISSALTYANSLGGACVHFPPGTYISSNQSLYKGVHILGSGINSTIVKLKNGTNNDLFSAQTSSISLGATSGSSTVGTLYNFSIRNMTLDGNKSNQSSGTSYPLRFYGYYFILENLVIKNGYTGGILCDWNGGGTVTPDSMEAHVVNIKVHDNNGIGIEWGGPHDSQFVNVISFLNGSHCFRVAPNATGMMFTNCHAWGPPASTNSVGYLIESGYGLYSNCEAEGSDTMQVVLLGNECIWTGGHIFDAGGFTGSGIQIGQLSGQTPYNHSFYQSGGVTTGMSLSGCQIDSIFSRCEGTNGSIYFANDTGNTVYAQIYQTAGSYFTGSLSAKTLLQIHGLGLTPDGSQAKGGAIIWPINAFSAFVIRDDGFNDVLNINTASKRFETPNGVTFKGYTDAYSTLAYQLNYDTHGSISTAGCFSSGQSSTSVVITSSTTIATAGIGSSRVNPAGNVSTMILQAGTQAGQQVAVVNESAFTIQFDIASTSHVADGTSATILANRCMFFVWNSSKSLWYRG